MRVNASTMEHVFPNLGAVKYCILHQNCVDFQAHPFRALPARVPGRWASQMIRWPMSPHASAGVAPG